MTPEQRKVLDDWLATSREGFGDTPQVLAMDAILAAHDAQSAELSDLRAMLALAARDDETGKAELGAAAEREACAAMLDDEAAECGTNAHVLAMQGASSYAEDMTGATCNRLASEIRARGPTLPLPDATEAVKAERAACVKVLEDLGWPELAQRIEFREDPARPRYVAQIVTDEAVRCVCNGAIYDLPRAPGSDIVVNDWVTLDSQGRAIRLER